MLHVHLVDPDPRLGEVAGERAGAVRESEPALRRQDDHVGAVVASIGHQRDAAPFGEVLELERVGEIGVGDDGAGDVEMRQVRDALLDRSVESAPGLPQHVRAEAGRPTRDRPVVADDPHVERRRGPHHGRRHPFGERRARARIEGGGESTLRVGERLDRDQDGGVGRGHVGECTTAVAARSQRDGACTPGSSVVPMTAATAASPVRRPARSVWLGAIGVAGGGRLDRHGVLAVDGADWELDWAVGDADGWRLASDEAAMRQGLVESTPVVTTALRVPDGAVEQSCWAVVDGDAPVTVVELHNAAPVAVAVALVVRRRRDGAIRSIDLSGVDVTIDGRPALTFGRAPSRSIVGTTAAVVDAVLAGLAEPQWPEAGGRDVTGDLAAAFVFPLPHTATLRIAVPSADRAVRDVSGLPGVDLVVSGWRTQTGASPRVDLPEAEAEAAVAATARHLLVRAGDGRPVDASGELLPGVVRA